MSLAAFIAVFASLSLGTTAFADGTLDSIRARKELRVATEPIAAPLNLKTPKGSHEGFEAELANVIAKKIGVKVKSVKDKWEKSPETAKAGNAHWGMNGLFRSADGKEADWGTYSKAYFESVLRKRTSKAYFESVLR